MWTHRQVLNTKVSDKRAASVRNAAQVNFLEAVPDVKKFLMPMEALPRRIHVCSWCTR